MEKNNDIQVLRAIGMLLILIGHMPIALPNFLLHGYSFVSLFFVISGYLMAKIFNLKYGTSFKSATVIKKEFVIKFFRLIPLMYIWILIYFIIGTFINNYGGSYGDMSRWASELKASVLLVYNYYLAGLSIGGLFGQYWSLFVEIHFYILSVIIFLVIRENKARIVASSIIVLAVILVLRPLTQANLVRYSTHTQLDSCFMGVIIACLFKDEPYLSKFKIPVAIKTLISSTLILLLFLTPYLFDSYFDNMNVKYFVYLVLSSTILFLARENDGWIFGGLLKKAKKLFVALGDSSASTYVCHIILFSGIYTNVYYYTNLIPDCIKTTSWGTWVQVIFLITIACVVGRISFELIEKPYAKFGKDIVKKITDQESMNSGAR